MDELYSREDGTRMKQVTSIKNPGLSRVWYRTARSLVVDVAVNSFAVLGCLH